MRYVLFVFGRTTVKTRTMLTTFLTDRMDLLALPRDARTIANSVPRNARICLMFDQCARMNANLPNNSVSRTATSLRAAACGYVQN
jgi:hypothetical protein